MVRVLHWIYIMFRSDAESVSTTISQDSRGSNKENKPGLESRNSRDLDDEVVLRRKSEYNKVICL
jgi:STE20-like kinase